MDRVLAAGFGNPHMGDDGVGPAVIQELRRRHPGHGLRLVDGGTDLLALPSLWRGECEVWLIDAMTAGALPGTIHRYDHDGLVAIRQRTSSCHHLSLPECLAWVLHTYPRMREIRIRFWGVEPAVVALSEPLSEAVMAAVPAVADEVCGEFGRRRSRCD